MIPFRRLLTLLSQLFPFSRKPALLWVQDEFRFKIRRR